MVTGKVFASAELIENIAKELNVSISALFYTPNEKSFDETDLSQVDSILEEEIIKSLWTIKNRIRLINQKQIQKQSF